LAGIAVLLDATIVRAVLLPAFRARAVSVTG
jgi:hypothetical protein